MSAPDDPFADQRLDGKIVVVTGSTQGLGAAIATRAARLGAAGVVVTGRDAERGADVRTGSATWGRRPCSSPATSPARPTAAP